MVVQGIKCLKGIIWLIALALLVTACGPGAVTTPTQIAPTNISTTDTTGDTTPEPVATVSTPAGVATSQATVGETSGASGKVVLYTSRAESLIKPVIDAFTRSHPNVEVVLLTGRGSELAAKLLEEQANPQADVFINTDALSMSHLAAQGVLAPNSSQEVMTVPDAYRSSDGSWVALTLRARVIMFNTNMIPGRELPTSMFDLTDSKYKGRLASADSTNDSMLAHVAAIRQLEGEEKAEEFVRGLVANETQFFGGHTDVRKAVGNGEFWMGLVNHYYYHLSKAEGAPVGVIYPDQGNDEMGVVVNSANAALVKGGPNPEAAAAFVDYLLSDDGQKIFAEQNYEYPIKPGMPLAEGVKPLSEFRIADVQLKDLRDQLDPTRALIQRLGMP